MMLSIPINIFKKRRSSSNRREYRLYIAYYYRTPSSRNPVKYHTAFVVIPAPPTHTHDMPESASECESPSSSVPPSPSSPIFQSSPFDIPSTNPALLAAAGTSTHPTNNTATPASKRAGAKRLKVTKFHVVNVAVNEKGRGRVLWQQRVESEYLDAPDAFVNLRSRLACLMFVGTVSSDNKVVRALKKVQVNRYADEFPDYLCTTWMDEALTMLVDEKIIPPLPTSPAEFWKIGAQYADRWIEEYGVHPVTIDAKAKIPCCGSNGNEFPTPLDSAREW